MIPVALSSLNIQIQHTTQNTRFTASSTTTFDNLHFLSPVFYSPTSFFSFSHDMDSCLTTIIFQERMEGLKFSLLSSSDRKTVEVNVAPSVDTFFDVVPSP